MSKRVILTLLLLILILGGFFRFYRLHDFPPGLYPDEAMNGNNALEAIATGNWKVFYPENNGREGLFINLQALSILTFGNTPWALRVVSALFGTLAILGIYLVAKELFQNDKLQMLNAEKSNIRHLTLSIWHSEKIPLLSAFFLATSYWHLNFSRISFRAIMVPFISTFALYFLLKGLREGKIYDLVFAGIFTGLGLYTYIAFRFVPFLMLVPMGWYFWKWYQERKTELKESGAGKHCIPCAILLFLFVAFVVSLPLMYYFLGHPEDVAGRAGQISIFSAASPIGEFIKSNIATLGMFFVHGDCNWRHNFNCQPELHPFVAFFFLLGLFIIFRSFFKKTTNYKLPSAFLISWLFFMSLPETLTREGIPHALRAIGLIPPVYIISALGAYVIGAFIIAWFEKQKNLWPAAEKIISRIQKKCAILFVLILLLIPLTTYYIYFALWAQKSETYSAFSTDLWHLGEFLNKTPRETKKIVIVNLPGVEVRGIPMPAETVMYATDTFREESRKEKNLEYKTLEDLRDEDYKITIPPGQETIIAFLSGGDLELIRKIKEGLSNEFRPFAPGDFTTLQNF